MASNIAFKTYGNVCDLRKYFRTVKEINLDDFVDTFYETGYDDWRDFLAFLRMASPGCVIRVDFANKRKVA